ncbi:MAG: TadE/TadG family type IV pilus assembly protein [Nevskiales bacterium]
MTLQFKFPKLGGPKGLRLWNNKAGNIAIITALMMIPLTFALGMAYDYTMAEARQDQINGMADVATLAGVTPNQMANSYATAKAFSSNLFASQIATVNGVVNMSSDWATCGGGDVASGVSVNRTMCITYTAASQNVFAKLLGMDTFPLKGSSTATSSTAPNIDFYLMMDTSPSMEIAATTTGMATLSGDTGFTSDPNCTFGCHQSNAAPLTSCTAGSHTDPTTHNPTTACQYVTPTTFQKIPCTGAGTYADGTTFTSSSTFPLTGRDYYDLTRCAGVTLRIDLLNSAAQNLMDTATTTATNDHATYRMAIYETDVNQANPANDLNLYTLQPLTSNLATAKTQAASIVALEMCTNNHLVCGDGNNDMDTYLDSDLTAMNALIPTPGTGTNNATDTPQEVMFIVTDGLNDEGSPRSYPPIDWSGAKCSAIKARNIRIAVLYTTYVAGSGGAWYNSAVQPGLPTGLPPGLPSTTPVGSDPMALAAQQCASTGLYYEVSTDGDVSAALIHLFQEAVAQARLLK